MPEADRIKPDFSPETGASPNQWLWIAWQRWPWIIVGLTIGLTGGAFYLHQSKPVYRSTAQVFVIRKHPEVLTTVMGQDAHQPLEDYLSSHLVLIKIPANIQHTLEKAELQSLPSLAGIANPANVVIGSLHVTRDTDSVGNYTNILNLSYQGPVAN